MVWKQEQTSWMEVVVELPPEMFLEINKHLDPIDLLTMSQVNSARRQQILSDPHWNADRLQAIGAQKAWQGLMEAHSENVMAAVARFFKGLLTDDPPTAAERLVDLDDLELLKTLARRSDCLTPQQQLDLSAAIKTMANKEPNELNRHDQDVCLRTFAPHFAALSPELRSELIKEADKTPHLPSGLEFLAYGLPAFSADRHEEWVAGIEKIGSAKGRWLAAKGFAVGLEWLSAERRDRLLAVVKALPPKMSVQALEPFVERIEIFQALERQDLINHAKSIQDENNRLSLLANFGAVLRALSPDQHEDLIRIFESCANGRLLGRFSAGAAALSHDRLQRLFNTNASLQVAQERQHALAGFAPALCALSPAQRQTVIDDGIIPLIETRPDLLAGLRRGLTTLTLQGAGDKVGSEFEDHVRNKGHRLDAQLEDHILRAIKALDPEKQAQALTALGQGLAPFAPDLFTKLRLIARKINDEKLRRRTELALSLS